MRAVAQASAAAGQDVFKTLFKRLTNEAPATAPAAPGHAYAYKASLVGPAHRYELTQDGLSWRTGRRAGVWAYADITAIRLSYRPMGMQHRRFRADIDHVDGRHITIFSTSKQTVALMEPQSGYASFIRELHRKLAAAGSAARLGAGLRPGIYTAIVVALSFIGVAMLALLLRALVIGAFAGAVFIVGFAGFFGWQISGFVRRNKPRNYTFDHVPDDLLP
jgi:hypothetical protein